MISSLTASWIYDNGGISLSQRQYEPFMWCENMTHILQTTNSSTRHRLKHCILFSRKKSEGKQTYLIKSKVIAAIVKKKNRKKWTHTKTHKWCALNPFNIIYKNKKTKEKWSIQYRIQICVTDLCSSIIRLMPGKNKHNWWTTVATVKGEAPGQHHNPRSFIVTSLDCEPCCRSEGMDFLSWNIYSSGSKSKIVG